MIKKFLRKYFGKTINQTIINKQVINEKLIKEYFVNYVGVYKTDFGKEYKQASGMFKARDTKGLIKCVKKKAKKNIPRDLGASAEYYKIKINSINRL